MNTTKPKRKRMTISDRVNKGIIVAKSYALSFHKTERVAEQVIMYNPLSYKVIARKVIFVG